MMTSTGIALIQKGLVLRKVIGGAYPADFCGGAVKREGNRTGKHVDFVAVSHSDEHVSVLGTRIHQRHGMSSIAQHRTNIQSLLKAL
ncbi:MAG: hypothetical protein CM15mP74_13680 [Halieaceae bacterium]|nr:MAG: hypothetical protein CM15mP74_13680 [Halieaceae bacterium]